MLNWLRRKYRMIIAFLYISPLVALYSSVFEITPAEIRIWDAGEHYSSSSIEELTQKLIRY